MKIYTSFVDGELKPILDAMPKKAQQTLVNPWINKLKHKVKTIKKQIEFLNQYSN